MDASNHGCHADSQTAFCASCSAWLKILYESQELAHGAPEPSGVGSFSMNLFSTKYITLKNGLKIFFIVSTKILD